MIQQLDWAAAGGRGHGSVIETYNNFKTHLQTLFDHPGQGQSSGHRILRLRLDTGTFFDNSINFLAADCGWNDEALITLYREGL